MGLTRAARISFSLGVLSVLAVLAGHLALTDIYHGEPDTTLEWRVVQISFGIIIAFQVTALITLGRFLRATGDLRQPDSDR